MPIYIDMPTPDAGDWPKRTPDTFDDIMNGEISKGESRPDRREGGEMRVRIADLTDRSAVVWAIEDFRDRGRDDFLSEHGYRRATSYFLEYEGELFDSKAIAAVAYGRQFRKGVPAPTEFSGGERTVAQALRALGFRVITTLKPAELISRDDILKTLELWDQVGRDRFLSDLDTEPAARFFIEQDGQHYDAKAIITVTYRETHPDETALASGDWKGDTTTVRKPLEDLGFTVVDNPTGDNQGSSPRRFWWVNQNKTHNEEIAGGFLWSPKKNKNNAYNQFYQNMVEANPGDYVISYYDTKVQHVGVVTTRAEDSPKPEFASVDDPWSDEGWLVGVDFTAVTKPFRPKDAIDAIRPLLPDKYSPLNKENGNGLQSIYLAEISEELFRLLLELAATTAPDTRPSNDYISETTAEILDESHVILVEGRDDIGERERTQLVKARRGQGVFRTNVRIHEAICRVTRIDDPRHLRASHIKPWRDSTDSEKINGNNGLMLAPHVDHLFDRGWISFTADGELLVSKQLKQGILELWGIESGTNVGPFNPTQAKFLEYHRNIVFLP